MISKSSNIEDLDIDQIFRESYSKLLSSFLSKYGTDLLESCENAIMEAYLKALKQWPDKGRPQNPAGWLYRVANNAYIDARRKEILFRGAVVEQELETKELDCDFGEEIRDPELKLLFLVCHPELKQKDQLALMLKTISGFGDNEISRALLMSKTAVKKRILRARQQIKAKALKFDWPRPEELNDRLKMVHTALYLLFNEGFYSSHPEQWMRKDLCLEAMRYNKYLVDHKCANFDTAALMSLMCYHISRYESRIDKNGDAILLSEQDRTKWDPFFIKLGGHYLKKSAIDSLEQRSKFQIEAFISALHCNAKSLKETNWNMVKNLYQSLYRIDKQDMVLLNLVMVHINLKEFQEAQRLYTLINVENFKNNKTTYYMVGVELYSKLKDLYQIELLLEKAIHSSDIPKETEVLKSRLEAFKKNN